ncbi:ran-binding protein m [Anaeramoeba ignava]|uniref:Ran-binding protein m n=1 Tax=Anaeramoeba ignava TaxID=1746090 RepID=A0A9Q0R7V1_ANAIG|nr:ran-binding protein m [Anaeramoeba ignava]
MSSILFKNTTGLILEGGPITMYEKGEYIGEGMLDTIQPNDTKIIPYAVELGCVVESDYGSTSQSFFHSAILNGVLTTERYYYYWRKYKINNKSTKKLDFILEHKITSNTELVYTIDPFEKTENYYRFRFNVPAKEHITFVVVERSRQPDTYYLESVSQSSVDSWLYSNLINKEIKETLYQIVQKLQSKNDLNRQLSTLKTELNDHIRNQRRICENMKTLKDSQDQRELRDRYVQELTTSEDEIESLRAKIKVLEKELQEMAKVIRQIVHEIKYDATIDVPKPSLPESQVKAHASINNKKLPYFPEKLDENLPSGFDMDMVKVGISCNSQDFTIHDQRSTTEPITIRSNFPIPDKTKIYYFEITIEDPGTKSTVVIGAVLDSHNLVGLPGWDDSIGFHGDDGKLYFCESKKGRKLGSKFSKNDTIGFGIDFSTKNFFFTFNGKLIKTIRDKKSVLIGKTLYPSIGLNSSNAKVSVNFGSIPFIHQLKSKY